MCSPAKSHPPASSSLSYDRERVKAPTCFLGDTPSQPTASFRTATHAASQGSAHSNTKSHKLPSVNYTPSLPPIQHGQFCSLSSRPQMAERVISWWESERFSVELCFNRKLNPLLKTWEGKPKRLNTSKGTKLCWQSTCALAAKLCWGFLCNTFGKHRISATDQEESLVAVEGYFHDMFTLAGVFLSTSVQLFSFIYHALQVAYLILSLVQKLFLEAFLLEQQDSFPAKTQNIFFF